MSRVSKHSLRCQLLALMRNTPRDAYACAERTQQPLQHIDALLLEMETEGLIETAGAPSLFTIAGACP